jgi:hypothetical protein
LIGCAFLRVAAHDAGSLIDTSPKFVTRDVLPARRPAAQERGTFREGEQHNRESFHFQERAMAVKEKKGRTTQRTVMRAEDWQKRYLSDEMLEDVKYEESTDNPEALADFLAKRIVDQVRAKLSSKR